MSFWRQYIGQTPLPVDAAQESHKDHGKLQVHRPRAESSMRWLSRASAVARRLLEGRGEVRGSPVVDKLPVSCQREDATANEGPCGILNRSRHL